MCGERKGGEKTSRARRGSYIMGVINLDETTKHDKLDKLIVKYFPYFLVACGIFITALTIYLDNFSFTGILYSICLGFVVGFICLGVICVFLSDKGVISGRTVIPVIIVLPIIFSVLFQNFDSAFSPSGFLVRFFDVFGGTEDIWSLLISVYSIILMIFLVAYAVVSVIVGYFRSYFYKVLMALEYPSEKRRNRIPEWLFQIPDIIDVKSVELEPEADDDKFDKPLFTSIAVSLFVLGIVICSYIFINPVFLQVIPFEEMLFISVLLSLFMSPLVIPWSIVRSVGAKVVSDAPRDLYLWKGMRGRLYQGFFAVTFIMMLLTMSVYMGMDFSRILTTYLGYVTFMGLIAGITSFVYVNTFHRGFKNGIVKSFLSTKYKEQLSAENEEEENNG
jgi:hypothetical protein